MPVAVEIDAWFCDMGRFSSQNHARLAVETKAEERSGGSDIL